MGRTVAVVVAVTQPKPLPFLAAARNGATRFAQWARALDYETTLLTDDGPHGLTLADFGAQLFEILTANTLPIDRLVLYFAGHGVLREIGEGLWLMSDWHSSMRGVAIEVLKRRLARFNISQVAIFSDACRSLPKTIDVADLVADPAIGRGPAHVSEPEFDKFLATQDGQETYAVPGESPEDDQCFFTGVLLEGLWGSTEDAFSKLQPGCVTSRSLGHFLRTKVPQVAERYGRSVAPSISPAFSDGSDVYYRINSVDEVPALPEWPEPRRETPTESEQIAASTPPASQGINLGSGAHRYKRIRPRRALPVPRPGAAERIVVARRTTLRARMADQARVLGSASGVSFAVDGPKIRRVFTSANTIGVGLVDPDRPWLRTITREGPPIDRPEPVLIDFNGGFVAALVALPGFVGSTIVGSKGVSALVYRKTHSKETPLPVEEAIAALESGGLRGPEVADLAAALRMEKHVDPVLGVISAYLYDSIGDVASIRQMAYYYVHHGQPIPYDLALLAQLRSTRRNGLVSVSVPAVASRSPRTQTERELAFTHAGTPEVQGIVGGLWPWMRQGWSYLQDAAADGNTLVSPWLTALVSELRPARFATLTRPGAEELVSAIGLEEIILKRR